MLPLNSQLMKGYEVIIETAWSVWTDCCKTRKSFVTLIFLWNDWQSWLIEKCIIFSHRNSRRRLDIKTEFQNLITQGRMKSKCLQHFFAEKLNQLFIVLIHFYRKRLFRMIESFYHAAAAMSKFITRVVCCFTLTIILRDQLCLLWRQLLGLLFCFGNAFQTFSVEKMFFQSMRYWIAWKSTSEPRQRFLLPTNCG